MVAEKYNRRDSFLVNFVPHMNRELNPTTPQHRKGGVFDSIDNDRRIKFHSLEVKRKMKGLDSADGVWQLQPSDEVLEYHRASLMS